MQSDNRCAPIALTRSTQHQVQNDHQQQPESSRQEPHVAGLDGKSLTELLRVRDHLLALAREIGVPDRIVINLPARELRITHDQMPLWPNSELQRHVLLYYLRSLTGLETGPKPLFRDNPLSPIIHDSTHQETPQQ